MRKIFFFLLVVATLVAEARQITITEARDVATEFFGLSASSNRINTKNIRQVSRKATSLSVEQEPFYIFNAGDNNGFVIISGDNRVKKILGYSNQGEFKDSNIPPQLKFLLDRYSAQIATVSENVPIDQSWTSLANDAGVTKLLPTANWGQGEPYNLHTPELEGQHALTGCVATAMAIVMKYHNWPDAYTWDSMPVDNINIQNSEELSRLMSDAGKSVFMNYGVSESSANMNWVGHKLQQDFKFSPDCQFISEKNFSKEQWNQMLRDNIDTGYPCIYSGTDFSRNVSHAFVLDGYSADKYHVNWGWDGLYNGYYTLDSLTPGEDNYSSSMGAVINIAPDRSGVKYSKCFVDYGYFWASAGLVPGMHISCDMIEKGVPFDINCHTYTCLPEYNGTIGYALVSEDGNIKEIIKTYYVNTWSDVENKYVNIGGNLVFDNIVINNDIEPSDRLQVVFKEDNTDDWLLVLGTLEAPSYIKVSEMKADLSNIKVIINHPDIVYNYYNKNQWEDIPYPGTSYKVVKGKYEGFQVSKKDDLKEDGFVMATLEGKGIYGDVVKLSDTKSINYSYVTYGDNYALTLDFIKAEDNKVINVERAGTLNSLISTKEALGVISLKVTGEIDATDIWYIRDNFTNISSLDLEEVSINSCDAIDGSFVDFSMSSKREADTMPPFAIAGLKHLQNIKLPVSLKTLDSNSLCSANLTSIDIPEGVVNIGLNALYSNANLEIVVCRNPNPVIINECVFTTTKCPDTGVLFVPTGSKNAYATTEVWQDFSQIIENDNPDLTELSPEIDGIKYKIKGNVAVVTGYDPEKIANDVVIPQHITSFEQQYPVKEIADHAFENSKVNSISMTDEVEYIGEWAFSMTEAKTVRLSDNIRYLPFASLASNYIEEINLPENLELIATAMPNMSSLRHLHIPAKVKRQNQSSNFGYSFDSLEEFTIDSANEDMCVKDGVLFDKDLTKLLNYPGKKTGIYTVPEGVTEIVSESFCNCTELEGIEWSSSVTRIQDNAIISCHKLKHISFQNINSLGGWVLNGCMELKSLTIGDVTYSSYAPLPH